MIDAPVWLDPDRSDDERVSALLGEMTLDELVGQLSMTANLDPSSSADAALLSAGGVGSTLLASGALAGSVRDDGVRGERVDALQDAAGTSRLGIPLLVARDVIHGHRTVFPIPLGLAASFDEELVERVAARSAAEARAEGITWVFAPMVDLVDDARWGRVAESLGESPLLTARLGAAFVRGLQSTGAVTACAKHYVGYGLSRGGRDYASVDVGELTLRNAHLRPFRAAVEAGVGTVMAAFSDVDGIPMHSHRHLLRGVLKQEWGFDGVVVADWDGIGELVAHGVAADLRDAARLAIEAGVDVDMVSGAYSAHLGELVTSGVVDRALVEDAARRVLRLKVRLGLLDAARTRPELPLPDRLDLPLAREAATASLVVLKDDALPIRQDGTVLLTGPYARERESLMGTWVLDGDPADVVTIADALAAAVPLVVDDGGFADRTLRLARAAATTIAVIGEHASRSGEDSSASDIGLPPGQLDLLRSLRTVTSRLIVVVFAGRPLALGPVLELADAVVLAWHPGMMGAPALADLLLGRTQAPGRLPMSLPRSAGHVPVSHRERPSGRPLPDDPRGRSRYLDSPSLPLVPFGTGRSALTYEALRGPASVMLREGAPRASAPDQAPDAVTDHEIVVELDISNPTDDAAREPVLLFARDEVAEITRPLRELIDFRIVEVAPRSTVTVVFRVPASALGYHGRDGRFRIDPGRSTLWAGWGRADASSLAVDVVLVDERPGDPDVP